MKQSSTAATVGRTVTAKVNGFIAPSFETEGWHRFYVGAPWRKPKDVPWKHIKAGLTQTEVTMHNARLIQCEHEGTAASFFDEHGFVLLDMPTEVKDWNEDYSKEDTDISRIYHRYEIDCSRTARTSPTSPRSRRYFGAVRSQETSSMRAAFTRTTPWASRTSRRPPRLTVSVLDYSCLSFTLL